MFNFFLEFSLKVKSICKRMTLRRILKRYDFVTVLAIDIFNAFVETIIKYA